VIASPGAIRLDAVMRLAALIFLLLTSACQRDETISAYGAGDKLWHLSEIDGKAFPSRATLSFSEPGRIAGVAPCNTYSGRMEAPYPWFEATEIAATRRACPDLAAEAAYFHALSAMTLAEVAGETLILSTPDGREMVFSGDQP
jgi:heat shock protein HslJ